MSHFPIVPPGLSACKCRSTQSANCRLDQLGVPPCGMSSLSWLPISAPPTNLDECFFFNSLVVRLLDSSIFWQFWLGFVFKLVVSFWSCKEAKCICLCLHLDQTSAQEFYPFKKILSFVDLAANHITELIRLTYS